MFSALSKGRIAGLGFVFLWFFVGGLAHFAKTDLEMSIMPPYIPWPRAVVLVSGVLAIGIAGAHCLEYPRPGGTPTAQGHRMNTRSLRCGPHEFWQELLPAEEPQPHGWQDYYAAPLRDGRRMILPLRDYGTKAFAGFIANQASFTVMDTLAQWIADDVAPVKPDLVVGLPTLGHVVGAAVARALGHPNWVAPGTTRKLWYEETLSVPTQSVTSPGTGRSMWLDPRLLERLSGRRVLLVDDVVTTGSSAGAGLALLARAGIVPVALAVAMTQGEEWRRHWDPAIPVFAAFATPQFKREGNGWVPITAGADAATVVAANTNTHTVSAANGL